MKVFISFLFLIIFVTSLPAQVKMEDDIETAYQNAKKGIYWCLSNIPDKKNRVENDLIAEDRLIAKVKLNKEVNGVRIESTGYNNSNEVMITIFRSNESLIKEGYLDSPVAREEK